MSTTYSVTLDGGASLAIDVCEPGAAAFQDFPAVLRLSTGRAYMLIPIYEGQLQDVATALQSSIKHIERLQEGDDQDLGPGDPPPYDAATATGMYDYE